MATKAIIVGKLLQDTAGTGFSDDKYSGGIDFMVSHVVFLCKPCVRTKEIEAAPLLWIPTDKGGRDNEDVENFHR